MKFKYRKYIYIGSFSAMILGMMVFSTLPFSGKKEEGKARAQVSSEAAIQLTPDGRVASGSAVSTGELKKDAYPEINTLIQNYFSALLRVDEKEISELVDNIEYVGLKDLPKRVKEIEAVDGIVCYTLEGPEEASYIVYAYNEVKFKNIPTKSTALDGFYVKKDATGKLRLILSPLEKEIQAIIDADSKREDVVALISSVNEKLKREVKSDKKLAALLKKMRKAELEREKKASQPSDKK